MKEVNETINQIKYSLDSEPMPNSNDNNAEKILKETNDKTMLDRRLPRLLTIGSDRETLFSSTFFKVILNRNNQIVPGMLQIIPISALNSWEEWEEKHWVELLQVQRLCELTLIKALDNRDQRLDPCQDIKLINFYGKQRRQEDRLYIHFDVVPRYSRTIQFNEQTFRDLNFGKPFDFTQILSLNDLLFNQLLSLLCILSQNERRFSFNVNTDSCLK